MYHQIVARKSLVAGTLGATLIAAAVGSQVWLKNISYKVNRVIDGDTFETMERQIIRLADTNAPEAGLCGSDEAKKQLEKLIQNKRVFLKVLYRDNFDRLIAWVYTPGNFVNEAMANSGWAVYEQKTAGLNKTLVNAKAQARQDKKGVYSQLCTQTTNPANPDCSIKANAIRRQYHFPGCGQYNNTDVQLYLGDQWFCAEMEAQKSGFTKGSDCFDKSFY